MNKTQIPQKDISSTSLSEEQQVLNEAEHIIQQFNNYNNNDNYKSKKFTKIKVFFIFPLLILMLLIFILSTIFSLINIKNTNIISGVYIQGIDVSNLSKKDATEKVSSILNEQLSKEITLKHNDYSTTILASQFNVTFDIDSAINDAYSIGRSGNIFTNNYAIINTLSSHINIKPSISYDVNLLNSIISTLNTSFPDAVVEPSYYVDGKSLIISNGKDGVVVDNDTLINNLFTYLGNLSNEPIQIEIPTVSSNAKDINIESIYNEIYKKASDAYYSTNPYVVYPSSTGLDFAISMDEAKNIVSQNQDECTIPLKILYPKVTTDQIGTEAFPDLLSEFTTSFATSNWNRSTNINLAASKINGKVIMPNETFSYNQTVGRRTVAAGFKEAPAYLNGNVVQEVGGGICQVSSTLYNAILYANLEITERHNHIFKPTYVKPGLDATVSWGGPDFKFTNNRNYPVRIMCNTSGKQLHIYIFGLKSDNDYKVSLDAYVVKNTSNGCTTATYKTLYDQFGNFVSKTCISNDFYGIHK